jgi:hypothetical protein
MNGKIVRQQMLLACCGMVMGILSLDVYADTSAPASDTAATPAAAEVMYLGDIKVTGQKVIIAVLQQVKTALNRPVDTSKEHENDIVCRIDSNTGYRTHHYLICATNKQFTHMRLMTQQSMLDARAQMGSSGTMADPALFLEHLTAQNPNHVLRVPVDVSKFETMMRSIPDASPEAAPAASTATGN